ncbi:MAG: hypothetical protein KDH96_08965 [Candidatus Riesia sp.]|nr:hypothetical protein [Candidatus Riesia sp.]
MSEINDITAYNRYSKLKKIFAAIKELSFQASSTEKRYPSPDMMTREELEALTRTYLALGMDLEELAKEWKTIYKEYKKEEKKNG